MKTGRGYCVIKCHTRQIINPTTSTPTPRSLNQHQHPQDGRSPPPGRRYTSLPGPTPSSPILPAHTLEDDLYQHFKSLPPPVHLQDQPRAAIIWRWAQWLVDVQGIDKENAQILAESHVKHRWQDAESSIQPNDEDTSNLWTEWEYSPPTSRPEERGNQAHETRTQLSAAQLNAMQTTHTGYTPPTSPAKPHQDHPESTFPPDHTTNPAQTLWEMPRNTGATDEPVATVWERTKYRPDSTPCVGPGSSRHEPHHIPADELASHLTNAIKAALKVSPNAIGSDLFLDARFRVPIPVAQAIASGAVEDNAANILPTLTSINAFVCVAAEGAANLRTLRL